MGTAYSWHPRSDPVNPEWPLMPPLLPDELLSSWLIRAAMRFGCNLKTLTSQIWPKWRVWSTDLDRGVSDNRLSPLMTISGMSKQNLQQASLRWVAEAIVQKPRKAKHVWAWILTLGSRGATRKGGLQYCPLCLQEDELPYYRIPWRLAWHVGCEQHLCSLVDRCWSCFAPLEPYRLAPEDRNIAICGRCKTDLRHAPTSAVIDDALSFQKMANKVLHTGYGNTLGEVMLSSEWFEIAHFYTALLRNANRSLGENSLSNLIFEVSGVNPQKLPIQFGTGFESLQTQERQLILPILQNLMNIERVELFRVFQKTGIKRRSFSPKELNPPRLITDLTKELPLTPHICKKAKKQRAGEPRPRHEVNRMMKRLMRKLERERL